MNTFLKGRMPKTSATMIVYAPDGGELHFPCENASLQVGDLVLLEKGKIIPADTKILVGNVTTQNAQGKNQTYGPKSVAIGGWIVLEGSAKGYVFAKAEESELALIE